MSSSIGNMDPYVYPGTNILKNLRNIRDPDRLDEFEAEATSRRLFQLALRPLPGGFDTKHLQAIHHHIFKDVYSWAGELRTVDIAKSGDLFALPQFVMPSLQTAFEELRKENHLQSADEVRFAHRGAYYLSELNAIHPFGDGKRV